jgi:hypothetical protein
VNLTSRIQSFTTGGQILISEATRQEVGQILKVGRHREVMAKGIETPIGLYEVLGIRGRYKLSLPDAVEALAPLPEPLRLRYELLEAGDKGVEPGKGHLTKLSAKSAEAHFDKPVPDLSNLKIHLIAKDGTEVPGTLYAKVVGTNASNGKDVSVHIRFTSVPPEAATLLGGLQALPTELPAKPAAKQGKAQGSPRQA